VVERPVSRHRGTRHDHGAILLKIVIIAQKLGGKIGLAAAE
jgi:hypothetical protein